jgi:hypothetical protein
LNPLQPANGEEGLNPIELNCSHGRGTFAAAGAAATTDLTLPAGRSRRPAVQNRLLQGARGVARMPWLFAAGCGRSTAPLVWGCSMRCSIEAADRWRQ